MPIDYSVFEAVGGIPKVRTQDRQRSIPDAKRAKRLDKAEQERVCRAAVKRRDKGKCVVPGCKDRSDHLHHITYRSKGGKWRTGNICSLCASHHAMVHQGRIQVSGDADVHLTITGDVDALRFKL